MEQSPSIPNNISLWMLLPELCIHDVVLLDMYSSKNKLDTFITPTKYKNDSLDNSFIVSPSKFINIHEINILLISIIIYIIFIL